MKCLNCGRASDHYLCDNCTTPDILSEIFYQLCYYRAETCEKPYVKEFVSGLTEKYAERNIIPSILEQFDFETAEYYYCQYYKASKDPRYESAALAYLQNHPFAERRTQKVVYGLIESYLPDDFIKPQRWCERILETDGLYCDLYSKAAGYFAMIGEYDLADVLTDKGLALCADAERSDMLYASPENMRSRLEKQRVTTNNYRTKKPYWPTTEERRRAVAVFYDAKGISYPRIESPAKKVPENEFAPIRECFDEAPKSYCTFWCSEMFAVVAVKSIYQIGAVKVVNGKETDYFESFIRPWDARASAKKTAAKEAGVPLEVIESAEDVDLVMKKFFDFVGDDVLMSTEALGNQAKLISRAARYAGMKEISNEFYDLLDLAADTSPDFDLSNNTRAHLLSSFGLAEGKTALEKAKLNKQLYDALLNWGD